MEDNKKKVVNEADFIAFLDGHMCGGGGAVKPKFEDGEMVDAREIKPYRDVLDESCPTCADIPNMMLRPDNDWEEEEMEDEE